MDKVVQNKTKMYPDLVMSFAWKDAHREIALTSGSVWQRRITTEDTFLYGSGTKPLTAAAVMRLIDQDRINVNDKLHKFLDPYLQKHGKPTMEQYFGEKIKKATILDVIKMSAGIRDFEDDYSFDVNTLSDGYHFWDYPYEAIKFSLSESNIKAGKGTGKLVCEPNSGCTSYSSTSYEVAGLLLTALLQPDSEWHEFDLATALFQDRSKYPQMHFPTKGQLKSTGLTVAGFSVSDDFTKGSQPVTLFDQDASILGFTCGNMVASPSNVARFFYHLFDEDGSKMNGEEIISRDSASIMRKTKKLSKGWAAGVLKYGAGIEGNTYGGYHNGEAVVTYGHEGATFAFLSASGYAEDLKGGYSLVINSDGRNMVSNTICPMLEVVKQVLTSNDEASAGCYHYYYTHSDNSLV